MTVFLKGRQVKYETVRSSLKLKHDTAEICHTAEQKWKKNKKRNLTKQVCSDFCEPFEKNEDFLPKLFFTKVVQTQISFLAALGRILNFIQAESKACFKALTPSNLCRGNTCPWGLLSFPAMPSTHFSYFLPLLTHKGKLGRNQLLLLCCRPDSLRIGLARCCQMKGKKMLKEIQWIILYFNYVTLHILPAGGENIYRLVYFYRKLCVLVRDWGKKIGLKPSEKKVYFGARGHVMWQWRASTTTKQAVYTQPWIPQQVDCSGSFSILLGNNFISVVQKWRF